MTLLAGCLSSAAAAAAVDRRLDSSATGMEPTGDDPADAIRDPTASPPPAPTATVDDLSTGSSFPPSSDAAPAATASSSPARPLLSFSVAAIMAKKHSAPPDDVRTSQRHHQHHRARENFDPVSPSSLRRAAAFTVDGILNGVASRTSPAADVDPDDAADDSSDSGSNRSSPGVARSLPPPGACTRPGLPFLHPSAAAAAATGIEVQACKWPPAGCPYPWQYAHPPSQ